MKLTELKSEVYRIAKVTTTKQLKAQYRDIQPLDLRYTASWEKALARLHKASQVEIETPSSQTTSASTEFEDWLENPPADYKDLFAEAGASLASFGEKLNKTKKLTEAAKAMVASLDEFAEAAVEEAKKLI